MLAVSVGVPPAAPELFGSAPLFYSTQERRCGTLYHSQGHPHESSVSSWCLGNGKWSNVHNSPVSCGQEGERVEHMAHGFGTCHSALRIQLEQDHQREKPRVLGKFWPTHRRIKVMLLQSHRVSQSENGSQHRVRHSQYCKAWGKDRSPLSHSEPPVQATAQS